jgi:hypothetical protein
MRVGWVGVAVRAATGRGIGTEAEDGCGGAAALHAVEEFELVGGRRRVLGDEFEGVDGLGAGFGGAGLGALVVDVGDCFDVGLAGGVHECHDELAECHACFVGGFLEGEGGGEEVADGGGLVGGEGWELVRGFHVGRVEVRRAASSGNGRMYAKLRTGVTVQSREVTTDGHRWTQMRERESEKELEWWNAESGDDSWTKI